MKDIIKITQTLKLLYVEDDEDARNTTLEMLKNFFTDISVAVDGQEALDIFHEKTFDLIISDVNMPKLDGIDMLKEVRSIDADIPVLIFSAHNEVRYFIETIKLGVDGYILKPLKLSQFILVIRKVVEKISLKQQSENYQEYLEKEVQIRTKELQTKLYYDSLTGLLSRYSFFKDIERIDCPIVFIIDIDEFKIINELYTTTVGSIVLKEFANFLLDFTKDSNYQLYRLASDEFVLWDRTQQIDLQKYENDIKRFFNMLKNFKVEVEKDSISVDVTIGFSTAQHDAYESAKVALEFAKNNKKRYAMYSTAIDRRKYEKDALSWKKTIKSAVDDNRVIAVYQPIVDKFGKAVKYETLMRIKDLNDELIYPYDFLDTAVKTKCYDELSSIIVFEALRLLDTSDYKLSLNFSYSDIKNSTFLNEIEVFFRADKELGSRAVFEITQSESTQNYDDVYKFIKRFRVYGIKIAIDDFGNGFSDFKHILEVRPDYLKIHGSLVENIHTNEESYILVKAIVRFSHELGIKVIAEHVHNEEIFDMLKEINVDEYQGFYFSKPLQTIENNYKSRQQAVHKKEVLGLVL